MNNIRIAKELVKIAKALIADDSNNNSNDDFKNNQQILDVIKKYNVTISDYRNGKRISVQDLEKFLKELNSVTNGNFRVFCYGTSCCPFAEENKFGRCDTYYNGTDFMKVFRRKKKEIRTDEMHWTNITADLSRSKLLITIDCRDALMGSWT